MSTHPVDDTHRARGSITAVVMCWTTLIVGLAGLVTDGGRVVTAHVRAADQAAGAARRGAQQLTDLRGGAPRIDCPRAERVVRDVIGRSPHDSLRIDCGPESLTVVVGVTVRTSALRMFGVGDRHVTVVREVRIVQG